MSKQTLTKILDTCKSGCLLGEWVLATPKALAINFGQPCKFANSSRIQFNPCLFACGHWQCTTLPTTENKSFYYHTQNAAVILFKIQILLAKSVSKDAPVQLIYDGNSGFRSLLDFAAINSFILGQKIIDRKFTGDFGIQHQLQV